MVRLSANSIRVVSDADDHGVDATPAENLREPDHVGAWLREAREATGRDLRDIAAHLRIRYPYLLAIEEGRFDDLPGRAYVVGFIRSYSAHLGLDGETMVARYKADAETVVTEQNLKFPTPAPEGRFPGASVLLVSAILAAALVGGWYYYQDRGTVRLDRVPPAPQATASPRPAAPDTVAATRPADAVAAAPKTALTPSDAAPRPDPTPQPSMASSSPVMATGTTAAETAAAEPVAPVASAAPAAPSAEPSGGVPDETPPPESVAAVARTGASAEPEYERMAAPEPPAATATPTAALPPVPEMSASEAEAGRVYGLSNRDARIVLSARGDSWVQVRDADRNALLTRMLHSGDSYHVPNREGLILSVGNPSVLDVSVDGAPDFQLSDENVPISDISLDPARLRDGTAIR